jgi:hypothetical protein
MHRALVFNGAYIVACASLVFFVRGKQVRREMDIKMSKREVNDV